MSRRGWVWVGVGVAAVVALCAIGGLVLDLLGFNPGLAVGRSFARGLEFWSRFWLWALIPVAIVVVGRLIGGPYTEKVERGQDSYDRAYYDAQGTVARVRAPHVISVVLALVALCVGFYFLLVQPMNRRMHDIRHDRIADVLAVEDSAAPAYEPRVPYVYAEAQLRRSAGDLPGMSLVGVWRFPVAEKSGVVSKTCALAIPDRNAWKRPVNRVVCVRDDGTVESAPFTGQVPSPDAYFKGLRLADDVNQRLPGAVFVESDLYGYIRDGQPYMVVPGRAFLGWWRPVTVWAGAVVYGPDGRPTVHKEATDDPASPHYVAGPVIGEALADEVIESLNDRGGFLQARKAEFAYDLADGSNVRNFALERADGSGMRLVTQLTPRGASQTPTAVLEVGMTRIKAGDWPASALRRLPPPESGRPRAADAEVRDRILQVYGASLDLANRKLDLLEITPGPEPDVVVTTIGSTSVLTGRIETNRVTREMCAYTATGVEIRCDPGNVTPRSRNALDAMFADEPAEVPADEQPQPAAAAPAAPADVAAMTNAQLVAQIDQLVEELKRRGQ